MKINDIQEGLYQTKHGFIEVNFDTEHGEKNISWRSHEAYHQHGLYKWLPFCIVFKEEEPIMFMQHALSTHLSWIKRDGHNHKYKEMMERIEWIKEGIRNPYKPTMTDKVLTFFKDRPDTILGIAAAIGVIMLTIMAYIANVIWKY